MLYLAAFGNCFIEEIMKCRLICTIVSSHLYDCFWKVFFVLLCFFVRMISRELTSMPILLFLLRKTGPELTSMPIFLHFMWDTATARPEKWCLSVHPGSEPRSPAAEHMHLTTMPQCRPWDSLHCTYTCAFRFLNFKIIPILIVTVSFQTETSILSSFYEKGSRYHPYWD